MIKIKSKKAMILYYPIVIGLVIALSSFYVLSSYKNTPKNTEFVGEVALESYKNAQNALIDLHYIKQSAKYTFYNQLYTFSERGTYYNEPECKHSLGMATVIGNVGDYTMWENIKEDETKIECYPLEQDIKINLAFFLNKELNDYLEKYPSTSLPKDNYDFLFEEQKETTKINGIATKNIIVPSDWVTYVIKPSFEIEVPYKLISKSQEYSENAKKIRNKIRDCLTIGSGKPGDKDLETCSNIDKLKKELPKIKDYGIQINPITTPKIYALLFDIEDSSFKNPFSEKKLTLKFGISFLDEFKPPATEITGIEERTSLGITSKYLTWNKNNASDVIEYSVYIRPIFKIKGFDGEEIITEKPDKIDKDDFLVTIENKIELDITALEKGEYYFYIVAHDNAGNIATEIQPMKLTI